jgi:L-threonylcarbamoyladenylate synthase
MTKKETQFLTLDNNNIPEVSLEVAMLLQKGKVCIIPTDTIYGIVALEQFRESVREIYNIKKRPADKPFIRLIGSIESLSWYTDQALPSELRKYWPGPLTLVFKGKQGSTVAIRYPDNEFLRSIFQRIVNSGIVAPSANVSGGDDIFSCESLNHTFGGMVDAIVCLKDKMKNRQASTIVDISVQPWRVVRTGALRVSI